ncbi:hypothetical protein BDC45DRAFT_505295, partial [Circinella umbellata]
PSFVHRHTETSTYRHNHLHTYIFNIPKEKMILEKAKITNDIDWCVKNVTTLNFILYKKTFKFELESDARRRYGDILTSRKILGSGEQERLKKAFIEYQKNNDCSIIEGKNRLKRQRELTDIELQVDANKTVKQYALNEGGMIRRKRMGEEME